MNIDFIKWLCEKADGFIWNKATIVYPNGLWCYVDSLVCDEAFQMIYYPLLLQRAIEGVNNFSYFNNAYYEIEQHRWGIELFDHRLPAPKNHIGYRRYESEGIKSYLTDQAKEAALRYIWEQEKDSE